MNDTPANDVKRTTELVAKIQKKEELTEADINDLKAFTKPYYSKDNETHKRSYKFSLLKKADYPTQFLLMYENKYLVKTLCSQDTVHHDAESNKLIRTAFEAAIYQPENKEMVIAIINDLKVKPNVVEAFFSTTTYHKHKLAKDFIRHLSVDSLNNLIQQTSAENKELIVKAALDKPHDEFKTLLQDSTHEFKSAILEHPTPEKPNKLKFLFKTSAAKIYKNLHTMKQQAEDHSPTKKDPKIDKK